MMFHIYLSILHFVGYYYCDSLQFSVGYDRGFIHVAKKASPCPGFNHGKNAPGGGCSSRSPPAHNILIVLLI